MKLRRNIFTVIVALVFAGTGVVGAQDTTQVLALDDCIRIGLDQSTQILLSKDS